MGTYTQILYQIVFATNRREGTLSKDKRSLLYRHIQGILRNKGCHPYLINGVEDHLHIVTHLHPTVPLAKLVHTIKLSSSRFIKETGIFPGFTGWQDGYSAFTYSIGQKRLLIDYVEHQEEHHRRTSFIEEYKALLLANDIPFDESFL